MFILFIYLAIIALIIIYFINLYNTLVKKRNLVEETWSTISILQKKRYNLVVNLVETVKGYAKHEKQTLENVISYRNSASTITDVTTKQIAEQNLNRSLVNLFAVSENYPDLKANVNFQQLQTELVVIETEIEKARKQYNRAVREYNTSIAIFPNSYIANTYNFKKADFYELNTNDSEKEVPRFTF